MVKNKARASIKRWLKKIVKLNKVMTDLSTNLGKYAILLLSREDAAITEQSKLEDFNRRFREINKEYGYLIRKIICVSS